MVACEGRRTTRSLPKRVGFFYGQRLTILGQGCIRLGFVCEIKKGVTIRYSVNELSTSSIVFSTSSILSR